MACITHSSGKTRNVCCCWSCSLPLSRFTKLLHSPCTVWSVGLVWCCGCSLSLRTQLTRCGLSSSCRHQHAAASVPRIYSTYHSAAVFVYAGCQNSTTTGSQNTTWTMSCAACASLLSSNKQGLVTAARSQASPTSIVQCQGTETELNAGSQRCVLFTAGCLSMTECLTHACARLQMRNCEMHLA